MANVNPLRYRGYYYDSETGFYYLQSRYYDPAIGRFINADSYASTGQDFIGYNMFAYCNNDPVRYIDNSGGVAAEATVTVTNIWNPIGWIAGLILVVEIVGIIIISDVIIDTLPPTVPPVVYNNTNTSGLPNQGPISENPEAPDVDAGKQGKHVPDHPNNDNSKTQWKEGETGVRETQEAWLNGKTVKPDGSVRVGTSSDGRKVKVHIDGNGRIHGYPLYTMVLLE